MTLSKTANSKKQKQKRRGNISDKQIACKNAYFPISKPYRTKLMWAELENNQTDSKKNILLINY